MAVLPFCTEKTPDHAIVKFLEGPSVVTVGGPCLRAVKQDWENYCFVNLDLSLFGETFIVEDSILQFEFAD